ncbi:peroxisomal coenzyme A diphosphatase 1, peroxisomal [[Candida] railenensis]|uniref:Peroxisomal coenzyme A diphosphatase 1, peroxisomal n=1 Tax=[Candida] railenensis TaxID=45579 RepID=A0A9P0VWW6_9ASCO|nr:peroxisomal coenzyme A diphosphatase 1, peroxisomal [[Candida] railenensis]
MVSEDFFLINIKRYRPRHFANGLTPIWSKVPVSRRSSVFILLFLGNMGELRVVLTKRSSRLRNFPGHISLPGGKSDSVEETEWDVARREMEEEIGLSADNEKLKNDYGFEIQHLNTLPCYLSRTFSAVKPCIGFMRSTSNSSTTQLEKTIQMHLNPGESSSIFSCPLKDFLYPSPIAPRENDPKPLESIDRSSLKVEWGKIPWNLRSYTFPQYNPNEVEWLKNIKDLSESDSEYSRSPSPLGEPSGGDPSGKPSESQQMLEPLERASEEAEKQIAAEIKKSKKNKLKEWGRLGSRRDSLTNEKIYDVWGLTANILHDLAEITYTSSPDSDTREISRELGEEELIYSLFEYGNQLQKRERSPEESKLISSTTAEDELGFNDVLPRTEFNRLKRLYTNK